MSDELFIATMVSSALTGVSLVLGIALGRKGVSAVEKELADVRRQAKNVSLDNISKSNEIKELQALNKDYQAQESKHRDTMVAATVELVKKLGLTPADLHNYEKKVLHDKRKAEAAGNEEKKPSDNIRRFQDLYRQMDANADPLWWNERNPPTFHSIFKGTY